MATFVAGGPLNPIENQNIIIYRSQLASILEDIINGNLYISLTSPRQTGKTTLLYQIQASLSKQGYGVVYIDFENCDDLDKTNFYQELCDNVNTSLSSFLEPTNEVSLTPQEVINETTFFKYLGELSKNTPKARKIVLMFDEIGGVPRLFSKTFFSTLRKVLTHSRGVQPECQLYKKISFIFSGALDLYKLTEGHNSPLSNVCGSPVYLDDFSEEQVYLLSKNLQGCAEDLTKILSEHVYKWCNGHPYLTQKLLGLIERSQEFSSIKSEEFSRWLEDLIKINFLNGKDANLDNILHYLERNSTSPRDSIFKILKNENLKTVNHDDELFVAGFLRRMDDQCLAIRNQIYVQTLEIFFEKEKDKWQEESKGTYEEN